METGRLEERSFYFLTGDFAVSRNRAIVAAILLAFFVGSAPGGGMDAMPRRRPVIVRFRFASETLDDCLLHVFLFQLREQVRGNRRRPLICFRSYLIVQHCSS
jgi:hypothetical protein